MKRLLFALLTVLLLLSPLGVSAEISQPDLSLLAEDGIITENEAAGEADISLWDKLCTAFVRGITMGIGDALTMLGLVTAALLFSSLLHAAAGLASSDTLKNSCELVSVLAVITAVFPFCRAVFVGIATAVGVLAKVMTAVTSGVTTLYVLSGNTAVAACNASSMFIMGTAMDIIASQQLLPFLQAAFALAAAGALPGVVNLSPVSAFVKNTATTITAFLFTAFAFMNYVQTAVAASADNLAFRSARFASGVFLPVVGNMLGDALRTVGGSIGVMKATVGTAGVAAVIALLLPPTLYVMCHRLALLLAGMMARVLGCEREGRFLTDAGGLLAVLYAITAGLSVVLIISLAMFLRMEVTL